MSSIRLSISLEDTGLGKERGCLLKDPSAIPSTKDDIELAGEKLKYVSKHEIRRPRWRSFNLQASVSNILWQALLWCQL